MLPNDQDKLEQLEEREPENKRPDLERAAKALGVTYEELRSAVDFGWVSGGTPA